MKTIVTGGAGLIGSIIVRLLNARGEADVLVAFDAVEAVRAFPSVRPEGRALVDRRYLVPITVSSGLQPAPEDPETSLLREETLSRLAGLLADMEQDKRDIIVLRYDKGYSLTRISQITGISYGMVKVKHKKALEFLRHELT